MGRCAQYIFQVEKKKVTQQHISCCYNCVWTHCACDVWEVCVCVQKTTLQEDLSNSQQQVTTRSEKQLYFSTSNSFYSLFFLSNIHMLFNFFSYNIAITYRSN